MKRCPIFCHWGTLKLNQQLDHYMLTTKPDFFFKGDVKQQKFLNIADRNKNLYNYFEEFLALPN